MDNVAFVNNVRTLASDEFKNRIPVASKTNLQAVADAIIEYPHAKNEFINVLTSIISGKY